MKINFCVALAVTVSVKSAEACVQQIEAEGVNKIVMLTHIGYSRDLAWMVNTVGIDVVVGGDPHSLVDGEDFKQFRNFPVRVSR
jgi:5'-nucleotidase/UDP-sugar diphosphatase